MAPNDSPELPKLDYKEVNSVEEWAETYWKNIRRIANCFNPQELVLKLELDDLEQRKEWRESEGSPYDYRILQKHWKERTLPEKMLNFLKSPEVIEKDKARMLEIHNEISQLHRAQFRLQDEANDDFNVRFADDKKLEETQPDDITNAIGDLYLAAGANNDLEAMLRPSDLRTLMSSAEDRTTDKDRIKFAGTEAVHERLFKPFLKPTEDERRRRRQEEARQEELASAAANAGKTAKTGHFWSRK